MFLQTMKWIYHLLILAVVIQLSTQIENPNELLKCFPNNRPTLSSPKALAPTLIQSRLDFSLEFMKNVFKKSKPGSNLFFSPHSVYQALLLALFVSNGHTENSIKMALQLPAQVVSYKMLIQTLAMEIWSIIRHTRIIIK